MPRTKAPPASDEGKSSAADAEQVFAREQVTRDTAMLVALNEARIKSEHAAQWRAVSEGVKKKLDEDAGGDPDITPGYRADDDPRATLAAVLRTAEQAIGDALYAHGPGAPNVPDEARRAAGVKALDRLYERAEPPRRPEREWGPKTTKALAKLRDGGRLPILPKPEWPAPGVVVGRRARVEERRRAVVAICDYLVAFRLELRDEPKFERALCGPTLSILLSQLTVIDPAFETLRAEVVLDAIDAPKVRGLRLAAKLSLACGAFDDVQTIKQVKRKFEKALEVHP